MISVYPNFNLPYISHCRFKSKLLIFSDSSDRGGKFEILSELASKERLFYYQLALIWQAVLTPLLQSGKCYNNITLQQHARK